MLQSVLISNVLVCTVHDGQKYFIPDNTLSLSVPDLPLHLLELCPGSLNNDGPFRRGETSGPELVVKHLLLANVRVE